MPWKSIPLAAKVLENADEAVLSGQVSAAMENCYLNDMAGLSRFPRLRALIDVPYDEPVFLYPKSFRDDLHGVCAGHTFRFNTDNNTAEDLTDFVVQGGKRPTWAETETELLIAAGGAITTLRGERTARLSPEAPNTTHVGYLDGYVVALDLNSGRFQNATNGQFDVWNPLDTFTAEGKPDNIVALAVTGYNELLLAGSNSTEQFDSAPEGSSPFFRRWVMDSGVYPPAAYTLTFSDQRSWAVSDKLEFVAFVAQSGESQSEDIQQSLENIDNWEGSWAQEIIIKGQRFIVLQVPYATNRYGTKGITFLRDQRKKRWSALYGWDEGPQRWQGWSVARIANRVFIGGVGKVYELTDTGDEDDIQRMLWRSAHTTRPGMAPFSVEEIVLHLKRGVGTGTTPPLLSLRVNKNNRGFGKWINKSLGLVGQNNMTLRFPKVGLCDSIQFEVQVTDNVQVELQEFYIRTTEFDR